MCAEQLAVARLPVRAVVPARIIYSGRKVVEQQFDSAYTALAPARASSLGGNYFITTQGDSAYAVRDGAARDTIRPK